MSLWQKVNHRPIDSIDLEREFEERLADSGTLAVRVAYGVLRNREDAEDVAQEALVRAYRRFRSLRDVARFRSWLVRITSRLALDYQRAARRHFVAEASFVTGAGVRLPAGPVQSDCVPLE
jgi:DNA-directed RNA polymerase specialized sigma24 family protein